MALGIQDYVLCGVALGNLALAGYVLLRNPKHAVHWAFFIFVTGFSTWMAALVFILATQKLLFNQLIFYGGITALLGLLMLAATFPDKKRLPKRFWLRSAPVALLYLGVPSHSFVSGLAATSDGMVTPVLGWGFPLFAVVFSIYTLASFGMFIRRYRKLQGTQRQQLWYFFLGVLVFFSTVLLANIALPAAGISQFNILGAIASLVFTLVVSFAIVQGRLFDLRFALFRTISFINTLIVFALLLAVLLFAGASLFFGVTITATQYILGLGLMVAAMLAFQPLQEMVRRFTDRFFFHGLYDSEWLLAELTHVMATTIDLENMTGGILAILKQRMSVSAAAFLLVDKHKISDVKAVGYEENELRDPGIEDLLHLSSKGQAYIAYDEIQDPKLKFLFRAKNISLAIPIRVEMNEIAVLVLGPKLSGEIYYQRDLDVLDIFASQAGIAIQNAKSYAAIKRFSGELERMVEKRTQELRDTQQRELEKAQAVAKLKDEFVFIAAHELRTPVTAIRGFLQLVEMSEQKFSKEVKEHLTHIKLASTHLSQLINDLLQIARSDSGTLTVEVTPVDIVPIIEEAAGQVSPLAKEKDIVVAVHAKIKEARVRADEDKVKEIIMNLVSNAIKYNRPGGQVNIRILANDAQVVVEVEDTGHGIPVDKQPQIFQKFFRAETKETQDVMGTGLGLFISRMLLEKMGGTITFRSQEGQGSTFSFTLPRG